jgi:transcriptional regulator with XRE-family HTH domain
MTQVTLAEKIKYLRKSRRMSQAELAHRLGLTSNAFISLIERGSRRPSDSLLKRLADLFSYDYTSLRALAGPSPQEAPNGGRSGVQEELVPVASADLVARMRREVEILGERVQELLEDGLPEFLWSRERRLHVEGSSGEIWIFAPAIAHHGLELDLLGQAVANLRRGARYRYLLPDTRESRVEAGRLLQRYQTELLQASGSKGARRGARHPGGGEAEAEDESYDLNEDLELPEMGFVSRLSFPILFEIALFDPSDGERVRGTLMPPEASPAWEVGLGREAARELARHFARLWATTLMPARSGAAG